MITKWLTKQLSFYLRITIQAAGQIDDEDKAMLDIGLKNGAKVRNRREL